MWQQEQTEHSGVGNLVVERLSMEVKEGRVNTNVVSEEGDEDNERDSSQTLELGV